MAGVDYGHGTLGAFKIHHSPTPPRALPGHLPKVVDHLDLGIGEMCETGQCGRAAVSVSAAHKKKTPAPLSEGEMSRGRQKKREFIIDCEFSPEIFSIEFARGTTRVIAYI